MKKLITTALVYGILGIVLEAAYRITNHYLFFEGVTTITSIYAHMLILGLLFFLAVMALDTKYALVTARNFNAFFVTYNFGMLLAVGCLIWQAVYPIFKLTVPEWGPNVFFWVSVAGQFFLLIGLIFFFMALYGRATKDGRDRVRARSKK